MNDKNTTDKLIDQIAFRIRNTSVPDYPELPLLDSLASALPEPNQQVLNQQAPVSRWAAGRKTFVVGCCLAVVLILAVRMSMRSDVDSVARPSIPNTSDVEGHVSDQIAAHMEPHVLKVSPVQVVPFDTTPVFRRMTDQLDQLDARLQSLQTEVALQQVQSDAATLLAEYTPHNPTVQ